MLLLLLLSLPLLLLLLLRFCPAPALAVILLCCCCCCCSYCCCCCWATIDIIISWDCWASYTNADCVIQFLGFPNGSRIAEQITLARYLDSCLSCQGSHGIKQGVPNVPMQLHGFPPGTGRSIRTQNRRWLISGHGHWTPETHRLRFNSDLLQANSITVCRRGTPCRSLCNGSERCFNG